MSVLDGSKFKPTLFVGLGGHGGKIVNLLGKKLRRHPHWSRIESMTHFVAIDTNKDDLDKLAHVPVECRFLASAFDRQAYVRRKRGKAEIDEDRLVTQWTGTDYQFRDTQGAGAGQIRMESRLGLYYNLEDDRAGIRRKIDQLLQSSTRIGNPWRDNDDRVIRIVIYASVAGGTGSGGFLPMAYLLRQMASDQGWGRPSVVGVFTLPTAFLERVKPELHEDILANGYAALKEGEFLTRQLGHEGGASEIELHFDPGTKNASRTKVTGRPFDIAYIVDRPTQVSIERYEHAIADASYLQIFSPILGAQKGEYDNYEKRQKSLANGEFSVHWGAFGSSILHFPRHDVIRYASLRYVARALRDFLCFGGDNPEFRVPYGDPAFERLSEDEKARKIDDAFIRYIDYMAELERAANENGVFTAVAQLRGRDGKNLLVALRERLKEVYGKLDQVIEISDIDAMGVNPGNPSMSRALDGLRREYAASLGRVNAELEVQRTSLRQGRFLGELFRAFDVSPIAQRLLLLRAMREAFLVPFDDPAEGDFLRPEAGTNPSLDDESVQQNVGRMNAELQRTATQGVFDKLKDRDNQAFQAAKRRAIGVYDELAQDARTELRRLFWRGFELELRQVASTLLATFRRTAEIADGAARAAESETEDFRRDPAREPESDCAQYYLDAEVLRDDRRGERLWHWLYAHLLDKTAYFVPADIFVQVSSAFNPARDSEGKLKQRDAAEVVRVVRESLLASGRAIYEKAFDDLKLDLGRTLEYEQRYIALTDEGKNPRELRATGKLEEAVDGVSAERVRGGVEDKLQRLWADCAILANIDERAGDGVTPARIAFVGLAPRFQTDEQTSLGSVLRRVAGNISVVEGWDDKDALVVYRAMLGIPIYWFANVDRVLGPAYASSAKNPNRAYPLHIEADWETTAERPGLPNLDPIEIRRARERERAASAQKTQAAERASRVRAFTLAAFGGSVIEADGGYAWSAAGATQALGKDRASAFTAFEALDGEVRGLLVQPGLDAWGAREGERAAKAKLLADLQTHQSRLAAVLLRATAEQREAEARFVKEERDEVASMLKELQGSS
ncbi:MAG: tubulin-like doman-containing protein [Labilithrix sp.]